MITKEYKANTNVSINVVLPSKKNLHISFIPLSDGSSVFHTDNADIQRAIENHYNFGKLFRIIGASGVETESPTVEEEDTETADFETTSGEVAQETSEGVAAAEEATAKEEAAEEDKKATAGEDNGLRKVTVSDIAAAKDYLADTLGISRTSMRSTKSILEKATENGIEFIGL